MKWRALAPLPLAALVATPAYAADYLTVAQAQAEFFPGQTLVQVPVTVDDALADALLERSGVHERFDPGQVWRSPQGGFFVVDHVVGKHETITFAVALDAHGAVKGVEILSYRETYGYEVRDASWRRQFVGKTSHDPVKLGEDIRNVSGATLSCKHVTQGVKRVLALYDLVLAKL
ncbi:MAG: FMN-binding protein [Frateuria sp.]|uniref:FMN-binding protein n=1 Tax=Frateuria sp. TaxID=2211372 RepID=UPI00180D1516|nr:FMN-binding protein [Frateuria sp.]NUO74040.1 FMN-binding protein [Frateuria sp.]NUR22962.1 FMN-binding protein [Frateuria sp.]